MVVSVSSAGSGRAGSTTRLPLPGHQPKAKTSSFFGFATCADAEVPKVTSTGVARDTSATITRLSGGPRASAQSCHKNRAVHRLQQVSSVCFARAGQSAIRERRWLPTIVVCLAQSAGGMHLATCPSRTSLLTRTRLQQLKTCNSTKTPRLAPSLNGFPRMSWPTRRRESVLSVLCWCPIEERDGEAPLWQQGA